MPPGTWRRALRWGTRLLGVLQQPSSRSLVPFQSPSPGDQSRCHRTGHQTQPGQEGNLHYISLWHYLLLCLYYYYYLLAFSLSLLHAALPRIAVTLLGHCSLTHHLPTKQIHLLNKSKPKSSVMGVLNSSCLADVTAHL